jgi:diacylglycerol O-acyltransferase / wax synthase
MSLPVRPADRTWLHMDRPNNLMHIHGLLRFDGVPDWEAVEAVIEDRLITRFPVFSRRAAQVDGTWVWEDDPDFSLAHHVRRVTLPGAGEGDGQDYISARFSQPFDKSRPLWELDFIEGIAGADGTPGGAMMLARFHHGLADGIRLVQVLLSLLDPVDTGSSAAPAAVGRSSAGGGPTAIAGSLARHVTTGTADFVSGVGSALTRAPAWVGQINPRHLPGVAASGPTGLVDAVTGMASEDNRLVNTWRSLGRLALSGRTTPSIWQGTPGVEKRVAWVTGLRLDEVRRTGRMHGVTVNDVLLASVSLGITRYLEDRAALDSDLVQWLIPVSLKPIDTELPKELGNHFALVMLPMPLGISNPHRLLRELHSRMNRIKNSAEPAVLYGVQRTIAETPAAVSVPITNYVANKSVGVLTNVPGPRVPMALAGTEVTGILGWVPTSGDQPLGLCIFTFNGTVSIGIAADAALVPDPDGLGRHIDRAARHLAALHHPGTAEG